MFIFRKCHFAVTALAFLAVTISPAAFAQTNLNVSMTVDNEYIAYISTDDTVAGTQIGADTDWTNTEQFSTALTPGVTNYIHILATNAGGVAMFIGEFSLDTTDFYFANGTQSLLTDTTNWQVSSTGFGAGYVAPADLGADGTAPWGNAANVNDAARYLWHPSGDTTTPVYFSAQIMPVTADLAVSVVENGPDPAVAGQDSLDYEFTITNTGPDDATNVVADFSALTINGGISGTCTRTPSQGSFTWPTWNVGTIANGASVTFTEVCPVMANSDDGANRTITLSITSLDQVDDDAANDSASEDTTIERQFDLGVSVVDSPDPVLAGSGAGNLTHTVTLSRSGPSDAEGVEVNVVPTLPAGVTIDSVVPSTGSWVGTTWTVGDWPASSNGSDETLVITLTVDNTASACTDCVEAVATASAASGTDTNGANDTASDPTSIETAAGAPTTFFTTIDFTNGYDGEVTVMISCNNGTPLEQDFEISAGTPVDFVVELLDFVAPDIHCTITLEAVDGGYVGSFLANGLDTGDACYFASEPEPGEAPFDLTLERMNTCAITAEPLPSTFVVNKVWEFEDNDIIDLNAFIHIECSPAASNTGPIFGTVSTDVVANPYGQDEFPLVFYASPAGTVCTAVENPFDSAVESDEGCAGGTDFVIGDDEKECAITNTVFFEGIPTLSQYGLAVMVLLMLGVGFVGLRRFV